MANAVDTVKSLEKGLCLLEVLLKEKRAMGVNELAKLSGMNASTTYRILQTLKTHGWVFQSEDTKYLLGEKIGFVTEKNNLYLALKDVALFVMQNNTQREGRPMNMAVRNGSSCVILQQTRTDRIIELVNPINSCIPIYASASGKVLLSELPDHLLNDILDTLDFQRLTKNTITNKFDFITELQTVKKQGWAIDLNESSEFVSCIAIPVRNPDGHVIASLSFSGFFNISSQAELMYYLPKLQEAVKEITDRLFLSKCR